jgi:hypothetical protein
LSFCCIFASNDEAIQYSHNSSDWRAAAVNIETQELPSLTLICDRRHNCFYSLAMENFNAFNTRLCISQIWNPFFPAHYYGTSMCGYGRLSSVFK